MGGCARLRWSAAGVRSVSSARIRCARALWAVSGRRPAPRPRGRRPRPAGLLASLSPPADRPGVPCLRRACRLQPAHLVAWRPLAAAAGAAGSLGRAPRNPSGIPEEVAVWAALASLAARRSPPGLLSLHRRPDDRPAHVRRKTSRPRAHPPSAAGGRRSLCFAQRRRRVRQQDASRVFPATRMRWRRALRDCGDAHTECCVRVWCLIARPLGRDWVCV